jgi:hypothetical protein
MGIQERASPNGDIRAAQGAALDYFRPSPERREGDPAEGKARLPNNIWHL